MTIFQYDLVSEPWIPCLDLQGRRVYRGLLDALLGAHILREVDGETPLVTAALYRLLLAVLHRVYGPPDLATWASLWREGRWQPEPVRAYLDLWRERLDLFHPERPFYQVAGNLPVKCKEINDLLHAASSGNNATLFDHATDSAGMMLDVGTAARQMLAIQAFGFCGSKGSSMHFTDAPWARDAIVITEGSNLFETLTLNLARPDAETIGIPPSQEDDDRPSWEMDDPFDPVREVPLGYLDYLTWQNRRVQLHPVRTAGQIWVSAVQVAPGQRLDLDVLDPLKAYVATPKGGLKPLRFHGSRALWRDSLTLLEARQARGSDAHHHCPYSVVWVQSAVANGNLGQADLPPLLYLLAVGMRSELGKDRVHSWHSERLPVPRAYLDDPDLVGDLSIALSLAEDVGDRLRWATRALASYLITPDLPQGQDRKTADRQRSQDLSSLQDHWAPGRSYWSALEVPFLDTLRAIPDDPDGALDAWVDLLRRQARASLHLITQSLAHDPAALKAIVHAERRLNAGLARALDRKEESPTTTVS